VTKVDDLAGAQGKFAMFVASLLQRAGVAPMEEFAELLGLYAESVADTDAAEAEILRQWAAGIAAATTHQ
jgi:hypothetical protein